MFLKYKYDKCRDNTKIKHKRIKQKEIRNYHQNHAYQSPYHQNPFHPRIKNSLVFKKDLKIHFLANQISFTSFDIHFLVLVGYLLVKKCHHEVLSDAHNISLLSYSKPNTANNNAPHTPCNVYDYIPFFSIANPHFLHFLTPNFLNNPSPNFSHSFPRCDSLHS